MTLTLSLLEEEEVHDFAVVDDAAMAGWPFAMAMALNMPGPRLQLVENWVLQGLRTDSTQTYLKVCDDETGEMIAGALWRFEPLGDGMGRDEKDATTKEEEEEEEDDEKEREKKYVKAVVEDEHEGARMAAAFAKARRDMWDEFSREYFPAQPYANLQILVTTPAHRRRGAASKLIEWGTQRADERGLKSVLMASEAGLSAYLKHGFEVVRQVEMDLRPYGVEATELRRWMVRQPARRL